MPAGATRTNHKSGQFLLARPQSRCADLYREPFQRRGIHAPGVRQPDAGYAGGGIGGSEQRAGLPPEEALLAFLDYLDGAPLFAFHVAFDETMLRKACKKFLGFDFRHTWADLAYLLPELFPDYANKYHALDDWLTHFSIGNDARHNALADALATAQLGLIALRAARAKRAADFRALQNMEKAQRWLNAAR